MVIPTQILFTGYVFRYMYFKSDACYFYDEFSYLVTFVRIVIIIIINDNNNNNSTGNDTF